MQFQRACHPFFNLVSLAIGALGYILHWNRVGEGYVFRLVNMANDLVITRFLAGLVGGCRQAAKPERHVQVMPQSACQ